MSSANSSLAGAFSNMSLHKRVKNKTKKNNTQKKNTPQCKIMTVNVGVYMLGGVNINETSFNKLPEDIKGKVNTYNAPGVSGEFKFVQLNKGATQWAKPYYNVILTNIIQEELCKKLLAKIKENDPDIICTQEDVLAKNDDKVFKPVYNSIYAENGYKVASVCESHLSFSEILRNKYGEPSDDKSDGNVKLGNVIYVKHDFVYETIESIQNLDKDPIICSANPRCAAAIKVNGKKIYNVHLCGGRFDDTKIFEDKSRINLKILEITKLIDEEADVIIGDFNSAIIPANYNYDYPKLLSAKGVTDEFITNWSNWQEGAITTLISKKYNTTYFPNKSNNNNKSKKNNLTEMIKTLEPTTNLGNTTVDWIFYNPKKIKTIENNVIYMYQETTNNLNSDLTDHHAVMATLEL